MTDSTDTTEQSSSTVSSPNRHSLVSSVIDEEENSTKEQIPSKKNGSKKKRHLPRHSHRNHKNRHARHHHASSNIDPDDAMYEDGSDNDVDNNQSHRSNRSSGFSIYDDDYNDEDDDEYSSSASTRHYRGTNLSRRMTEDELIRGIPIYTSTTNPNDYVILGKRKYLKSELREAFGGTLMPGVAPPTTHKFGNPVPLGLSAFALTTFVLSFFNARVKHVATPNMVVGLAMFYGGLVQIIAGIWEIALENTFGGTALCSYGGFWMSFGAIFIPWFGIQAAYEGHPREFDNALAIFLLAWCIFTFGLAVCTVKSTVMFFLLFFLLAITFLLLSLGSFCNSPGVTRAGGILGIIVAVIAWYNAFAGLATEENSYIVAHPLPLPGNEKYFHLKINKNAKNNKPLEFIHDKSVDDMETLAGQ
ncbi:hypothetical protein TBLA_0C01050 [Henningerozyma blattae CBS 6284]|uniref:Ammonia transport outward protein 2 n=1 Tax=Henningerozyma blattae (strain ATCC 34711 / CBS 6284 / DSM 70876 / NBRC 10599 / NRRL Y-10934 / UCD 77-7) TaxID=1071380 RepID=I2H0L8_HENB6|nr:hypothetical protein TBLA_0C01050 [Tetrapisispora blattae CBS 6284]CCH59920.1 hypothetical protein TBLA_0C01050 [Tetrapisispora blattae CBS 6284]